MDETIYVILKVLFDFALEEWFSIVLCYLCQRASEGYTGSGSGLKNKKSQRVGPRLKVSSDRLVEPGDNFQNS